MNDNLVMLAMDTLKAYEALTAAKMPEEQARVLVSIVQDLQEARLANVSTKQDLEVSQAELKTDIANLRTELKTDIANLRAEFKADIADLRGELKADIAEVKSSLIRWMFGFFIGQVAVLAGLIKLLK